MPRNGSGVYSADWVNASPNTTIESAKQNAMIADLVTDANAARPITAGGTGAVTAALARAALAVPGTATENVFTKTQIWAKGADVASAAALNTTDDGNYFDITGTTTITSIVTVGVGAIIKLHFDGILTLTHHATDLILPGGANITTAAGDEAEFVEYATGDWRCTNYQRANTSPSSGITWETVKKESFSGVASLDLSSASAYVRLRVSCYIIPSDDSVSITVRTKTAAAADTGASDYDYLRFYTQSGVVGTGTATTSAVPMNLSNVGNAANEAIHFSIEIEQFNKTTYAWASYSASETAADGTRSVTRGEFRRLSTTGRDGLLIQTSAGTISGNWFVEGMRG